MKNKVQLKFSGSVEECTSLGLCTCTALSILVSVFISLFKKCSNLTPDIRKQPHLRFSNEWPPEGALYIYL